MSLMFIVQFFRNVINRPAKHNPVLHPNVPPLYSPHSMSCHMAKVNIKYENYTVAQKNISLRENSNAHINDTAPTVSE